MTLSGKGKSEISNAKFSQQPNWFTWDSLEKPLILVVKLAVSKMLLPNCVTEFMLIELQFPKIDEYPRTFEKIRFSFVWSCSTNSVFEFQTCPKMGSTSRKFPQNWNLPQVQHFRNFQYFWCWQFLFKVWRVWGERWNISKLVKQSCCPNFVASDWATYWD